MIRLILIFIFLILYFLIGLFTNLYIMIVRKKDFNKAIDISNRLVGNGFSLILAIAGTKKIVRGLENIPETSALYVGNHRSNFDIVVTHSSLKKAGASGTYRVPLGFIAKLELDKIPFLRSWMRNIGCLFLDRKDTRSALKSIMEGVDILKEGHRSLVIYPEGTRGHTDEMKPFKKGSFKLAERSKVPIVPVAIFGSDDIFENNPWIFKIRPAKVYITFGEPIDTASLDKETLKHIDSYVQDKVAKLIEQTKKEIA